MKRLFSIITAFALCLSLLPNPVQAADGADTSPSTERKTVTIDVSEMLYIPGNSYGGKPTGGIQIVNGTYSYITKNPDDPTDISDVVSNTMENTDLIITGTTTLMIIQIDDSISAIGGTVTLKDLTIDNYDNGNVPLSIRKSSTEPTGESAAIRIEGDVELRSQTYSVQVVDSVKAELSGSGNFTAAARKGDKQTGEVVTLQNSKNGGLSIDVEGDVTLKAEATGTQSTPSTADHNFPIFINQLLEPKTTPDLNPIPRPFITIQGKSVTLIRTKELSKCTSGEEYVKINEEKQVKTGVVVTSDTINQLSSITKAYDNNLQLDLSNQTTDITYQNPFNESQGYTWDAKTKTLTLNNFITPETLTLPDDTVTIVTKGTCIIGTLKTVDSPQKAHLIFTGDGDNTLTIEQQINIAGGDNLSLTVDTGANVIAQGGISIGSSGGTNSTVTINGTLKANGGDGCALSAGKVAVGNNGTLEVSGGTGVQLNGMPKDGDNQYKGVFTVAGDGKFNANCSEFNLTVSTSNSENFSDNDLNNIIENAETYLPENCKMGIHEYEEDGRKVSTICLLGADGKPYSGALTIHQNHQYDDTWVFDETSHWHACTIEGCNKEKPDSKAVHQCGYEVINGDGTQHLKKCTVCGWNIKESHSWNRDAATCTEAKQCTACGYVAEVAPGHNWGAWSKKDESNHEQSCTRNCGAKQSEQHRSTGENVATCQKKAVCDICSAEYGDVGQHNTQGVNWTADISDKENHWKICTVCHQKTVSELHKWKAATCTEPAICTVCNITGTAALGHKEGETWEPNEQEHWKACTVCGEEITNTRAEHTPDHDAPTETEPVRCSVCGYIITPVLGHQHDWFKEDWDTEQIPNGFDKTWHWYKCSGCNEIHQKEEHTFDDWIIDEEATAETEGSKHRVCNVCKFKETATIPVIGHTHIFGETWEKDSSGHWHECECGEKSDEREHIYDGDSDTTCNVCGYERTVNQPENPDSTYHITPDTTPEYGTIEIVPNSAQAGDRVTLTATPEQGYRFKEWEIVSDNVTLTDEQKTTNPLTFTMPEGDVIIRAVFEENRYTVTAPEEEQRNGTVEISSESAKAGDRVTLTAKPEQGYHFKEWEVISGNVTLTEKEKTTSPLTFTMPEGDVSIRAVFEKDSPPSRPSGGGSGGGGGSGSSSFGITIEQPEHGKVTANPLNAGKGTTITLTVTPDDGYQMKSLTVTDNRNNAVNLTEQGNGKYTFTMPDGGIKVKAVFEPLPEPSKSDENNGDAAPALSYSDYTDLDPNAWYSGAVDYVLKAGLMQGYGDKTFAPNDTLSRAMLAQILYNREGKPATTGNSGFTDVTDGQWYAPAVAWAASKGIISGYNDGRFGSNDNITREQVTVMLWRYAGSPAAKNQELSFSDTDETSEWAADALRWAVENDILHGYNDGRLDPKGFITRAETAQILQNYLK